MRALLGLHDNNAQDNGNVFNLTFNVGTAYACNRILVCVSTTCTLPVDFVSFTAEKVDSYNLLSWTTASEKNSSYFEVQKSYDGIHFISIGKVQAAGTSSSIRQYSFKDESPAASGIVYYQLVEYDIDGQSTNSEIKTIRNSSQNDLTVVPNPSNGNFTVNIEGLSSGLSLVVYNTLGQVVYQSHEVNTADAAVYSKNIDIQNMAAGVYILHVSSSGQTWTKKIIKE
jgi:hypothetical protein